MNAKVLPLFAVGLLVLVLVLGYQQYVHQTAMQADLRDDVLLLKQQLADLESRLASTEQAVASLDKQSVKGIVDTANEAIIDGWEALLNSVDEELKRARKSLKEDVDPQRPITPASPDSARSAL